MHKNKPQQGISPEKSAIDELLEINNLLKELIRHFDTNGNESLLQIKAQVSKIQSVELEQKSPDGQLLRRIALAKLKLEELLVIAEGTLQQLTSSGESSSLVITILTRIHNAKIQKEITKISSGIHRDVGIILNINPEVTAIYRDIACK